LVRSAAKSQLICPVKQSTKIEFSARSRTPGVRIPVSGFAVV
jgi:hypothetical protein